MRRRDRHGGSFRGGTRWSGRARCSSRWRPSIRMARWPGVSAASARGGHWRRSSGPTGFRCPGGPSASTARIIRQRLRALGADPSTTGRRAGTIRRPSSPTATSPFSFAEPARRSRTAQGGVLWRASVVEDDAGLWAVEEGNDFVLRGAGGKPTLVLAEGGRLVNADVSDRGGRGRGVWASGRGARSRRDRRRGVRPRRSLRRASLGSAAPVARQRDKALRSGERWPPRLSSPRR